jgi:hypothetical protein
MHSMDLIRAFTEHPTSVGESYGEHLLRAVCFGVRMLFTGLACLVHGFLPFLFVHTGSRTITELNHRMVVARQLRPLPPITSDERLPL